MPFKHKEFVVTGAPNTTRWDEGIQSTEAITKKVHYLLVQTSGYQGNFVEAKLEETTFLKIPDYILDTEANTGTTNTLYSTTKTQKIPVDLELPLGKRFRVGIVCGATATNLRGAYVYEEL